MQKENQNIKIRSATIQDVEPIVALLRDDFLGKAREEDDISLYQKGLSAILDDKNNDFFIAMLDHEIVGCFQYTIIPSLSRGASMRVQIESVRVSSKHRNAKIGSSMMQWAIDRAKGEGANLVQLTTDLQRDDAKRFYLKLGFEHSHSGMKMKL